MPRVHQGSLDRHASAQFEKEDGSSGKLIREYRKMADVYLRPNVLIEPLYNQWYAWPNLISPATAAMYVANQHLKIMQSFVAAPQVHVSALKKPALLGGPFINYDASQAPAIRELM